MITIKKLQKTKTKTWYASKEENEEMNKRKTKISGAPNENIVQKHLNMALLNLF